MIEPRPTRPGAGDTLRARAAAARHPEGRDALRAAARAADEDDARALFRIAAALWREADRCRNLGADTLAAVHEDSARQAERDALTTLGMW